MGYSCSATRLLSLYVVLSGKEASISHPRLAIVSARFFPDHDFSAPGKRSDSSTLDFEISSYPSTWSALIANPYVAVRAESTRGKSSSPTLAVLTDGLLFRQNLPSTSTCLALTTMQVPRLTRISSPMVPTKAMTLDLSPRVAPF